MTARGLVLRRLLLVSAAMGLALGSVLLTACQSADIGKRPVPASGSATSSPLIPPASSPQMAALSSFPTPTRAAHAPTAHRQQGAATLVVRVQKRIVPGVAPAAGVTVPAPPAYPVGVGAAVRVVAPAAPNAVVAEQATDAHGEARFSLAPGAYWVYVPAHDSVAGGAGGNGGAANLPDGQPVLAWQGTALQPGDIVDVTLIMLKPQS
jgi:hypothetical protein